MNNNQVFKNLSFFIDFVEYKNYNKFLTTIDFEKIYTHEETKSLILKLQEEYKKARDIAFNLFELSLPCFFAFVGTIKRHKASAGGEHIFYTDEKLYIKHRITTNLNGVPYGWTAQTEVPRLESELNEILKSLCVVWDEKKTNIYAGMLKKYESLKFNKKYNNTNVNEIIKKKEWTYLYGEVGSGKTGLALYTAIQYAQIKKESTFYINEVELMNELREDIAQQTNNNLINKCINASLLVFDDFGKTNLTKFVAEKLYYIIDQRYMHERTTIFTSNLHIRDYYKKYINTSGVTNDYIQSIGRRITELSKIIEIKR